MRALPVESFTVVMATGVVAVAARDNGQPSIALFLAVLAGGGLALIVVWVAVALLSTGRGIVRAGKPVDRTCGLFGFVAAANVVAAQFDPARPVLITLLGAVALSAWGVVMTRLIVILRVAGWAALCAGARGSWLLPVVATQSLVLTAARLATTPAATPALLVASVTAWTTALLGYLMIVVSVIRRLLRARLAPHLLTPDIWIIMGAQAITVVAGGTLVEDLDAIGQSSRLRAAGVATVTTCWLVATAWIPLLVGAELRARARRPHLGTSRWPTVFPLGMYAAACATLATIVPSERELLHDASTTMFWVASTAWFATTICMSSSPLRVHQAAAAHGTAPRGVGLSVPITAASDGTRDVGDDVPLPRIGKVAVVAHCKKSLDGGLVELRSRLAEQHVEDLLWYEVKKSKKAPKRVHHAIEAGADLIIAWGGDGLVQRCLDSLAGSDVPVGIIPAGTANLLAHNLGVPENLAEALDIALTGPRRPLDLGRINGEHFAVMAGVGFDAELMDDVDGQMKSRLGRLAYFWTGLRHIRRAASPVKITVDGRSWFDGMASCVLLGNVGRITGGIPAFDDAHPDDGWLEVGVATANGPLQWARTLGRIVAGRTDDSPFVCVTRARRIVIRLAAPRTYELDGGSRGMTDRLSAHVVPHAVAVCVPPTSPRAADRDVSIALAASTERSRPPRRSAPPVRGRLHSGPSSPT